MKYNNLELTQTILSSMDSDEVNSVSDTVESQQVLKIIRSSYFDMLSRANLPETYSIVNLDASIDVSKPTVMYLPETVDKIVDIKYDAATEDDPDANMKHILPLPVDKFMDLMHSYNPDDDNVSSFSLTIDTDTFVIYYMNDRAPTYYTSFNDRTVLFDSFDAEVDSTLQKNKSFVYARKIIPFEMTDTFVPDLDDAQFALLLNEAKSLAWAELKQTAHPKAERNAKRGWNTLQRSKTAIELSSDFDKLPYYGRV